MPSDAQREEYRALGLTDVEIDALTDELITLDEAKALFEQHFPMTGSTWRKVFRAYVKVNAYGQRVRRRGGREVVEPAVRACSKRQVLQAIATIKLSRQLAA